MILESIQTRIIAGFTIVTLITFSVLVFQVKILKTELHKEQQKVEYYKQQTTFYEQQIKLLQDENNQLVQELNSIKRRIKQVEKTQKKIQRKKEQYNEMKKKIDRVTVNKREHIDEKEVIKLINSFFNCSDSK